ncbi:hypothetical protein [Candidatus Symbiopectobacterium sp. NZEC135]|uniref:hypothetical protein n=1 Tax=Candidatus Symbiopectobacterium sp. NZEC135 TaxID=2820471 RepID=UPI00222721BF|nr:hypothetical protein [Candidatus Symbiopectobacterium sp. NZEC135]MCW2477715.1 hypothetical protein [Candidatus Symbiopectobacterium sp. NZEC135]
MKYKVGGVYKHVLSDTRFVVFSVNKTLSGTAVWIRRLDNKLPDDFVGTWNLTNNECEDVSDVAKGLSSIVKTGHIRLCDAKEIMMNRFGLKIKGRSAIDFIKSLNDIATAQAA